MALQGYRMVDDIGWRNFCQFIESRKKSQNNQDRAVAGIKTLG
jgi:hypothetical protein